MRKTLALVTTAASFAALAVAASPASATDVTFTVQTDLLGISQPTAVATLTGTTLVSGVDTVFKGALGETTVTDNRGGLLGWTSNIAGSAFTNGTTTIAVDKTGAFVPGTITTTGTVTAAALYTTEATALPLTTSAQGLVTGTLVSGNNTATFTPHIKVAVPSTATAGKYTGTITQTVS